MMGWRAGLKGTFFCPNISALFIMSRTCSELSALNALESYFFEAVVLREVWVAPITEPAPVDEPICFENSSTAYPTTLFIL